MSDEVSIFLRSVEKLKDRRDEEEEARSRELEEKILQERKERQARREERARSISPQKSSPANTPPPSSSPRKHAEDLSLASPTIPDLSSALQSRTSRPAADAMDMSSRYSVSPTKENESPFDLDSKRSSTNVTSPPSSAVPTRTPTLSWQRRPTSQSSDRPRSRPLSMVAAENAAARSTTPPAEAASPDQAYSRDQITQALSSRDPSWFRQTADRGHGSAAYRRTQVEDGDTVDMAPGPAQLPGMSRTSSSAEPENNSSKDRPSSQSRLGSPLSLTSEQKLGPPADITGVDVPGSGRTSPTRPISPTKGMGGFVQSAMMKRTDSVKRWSVNSPIGLQRAGSTLSNRNSFDNKDRTASSHTEATSRPGSRGSRPTSSHASQLSPLAMESSPLEKEHNGSKQQDAEKTPPSSPSKTMDTRRWSPTKGSWLEAALNKPESPKPKPATPHNTQPAWMVELNKAKAERAKNPSVDLGRGGSIVRKHEVKTGGLVRPAPPGAAAKPPSLGAFSSTSLPSEKVAASSLRGSILKSSAATESPSTDKEGPERRGSVAGPSTTKAKPETPPKKDFRAGLKSRPAPAHGDEGQTNELQSVFGNLRKTKTQNYVAPDELKSNIMRGKAALNITGGPRPYEKRDEFKDAILKKKADFKQAKEEGRGIRTNSDARKEEAVPEGLAKRAAMSRSNTISDVRGLSSLPSPTDAFPDAANSARSSVLPTTSPRHITQEPAEMATATTKSSKPDPSPFSAPEKEKSAPGRLQNKPAGSVLANRFNPALAGLLARGPPGIGAAPVRSAGNPTGCDSSTAGSEPGPGPQLTHMTKNRARGPRRKAPSSAVNKAVEGSDASAPASTPQQTRPAGSEVAQKVREFRSKSITSPRPDFSPRTVRRSESPSKMAVSGDRPAHNGVISLVDSSKNYAVEEKPISTGNVISLVDSSRNRSAPGSPKKVHEQVAALAAKKRESLVQPAEEKKVEEPPPSPRKLDMKRMSRFLDEGSQPSSPKNEPERRSPSPTKRFFQEPTTPRRLPQVEKNKTEPAPSMRNGTALFGGSMVAVQTQPSPAEKAVPAPLTLRPRSPTKLGSRPLPAPPSPGNEATPLASPTRSPSKYASEVSMMLNDFFGNDRPTRDYRVDAAEILMNRPKAGSRVQTQKAQLYQISGDGKKMPVPGHYERVLFEREMYLCSHTFTNESRKKLSEVYFWAGDEVPQSIIDDVQVFINKEARSMGGTLVKMCQGKETPEFIQALGGIIIVRRGSSNKYDSLASNMLCGRQYLGQVVFDEVDFSPMGLCSGFPYLITQQGKCYLWKGKGSGVDELGCGRLIGMDLALMGELTEVEEGTEPEQFWGLFDGVKKMSSADHWRLKPNYDKYCARLFCSSTTNRKQITELRPFNQADLEANKIYVLDAFFEMYIVVGKQAQTQYAAFRNALDFAQEYAILAAGMEDRPFVPISTVVLEGIPRDMRSVFRKWRDDASPTKMNLTTPTTPNLKRGRSLRVVPLNQALRALSE